MGTALELATLPPCWCHQDFDVVYGLAMLVVVGFEQWMSLCSKVTMFIARPQRAPKPAQTWAPRVQCQDFRAGRWFATTRGGVILN
jgi:hypothetical protein